jgi:hypothetical protein
MTPIDIALAHLLRRIRDALPGPTTASRLKPDPNSWRNAPPEQRGAAYVQFYRTRQELRRIHIEQKIAPKIVHFLFEVACSELGLTIALVVGLCVLVLLLNP